MRVPHPKPGFRQTRRVLPTVTEKVSTALLLGETPQGRNRHGKDEADVFNHDVLTFVFKILMYQSLKIRVFF